jgi:uncharacterized membrane protein
MENQKNKSNEREFAAFSYLWIFSILILLGKRDNEFIQHHARRASVLFLLSLIFWAVPFLRYGEFLILVLMIFGFITAAQGNENATPILSEFADGSLRPGHIKHYWKVLKYGVIKLFKPNYEAPELRTELKTEEKKSYDEQKILAKSERITDLEEKKLSALYHRVGEDEKRIDELADEVHTLERDMGEMKK